MRIDEYLKLIKNLKDESCALQEELKSLEERFRELSSIKNAISLLKDSGGLLSMYSFGVNLADYDYGVLTEEYLDEVFSDETFKKNISAEIDKVFRYEKSGLSKYDFLHMSYPLQSMMAEKICFVLEKSDSKNDDFRQILSQELSKSIYKYYNLHKKDLLDINTLKFALYFKMFFNKIESVSNSLACDAALIEYVMIKNLCALDSSNK